MVPRFAAGGDAHRYDSGGICSVGWRRPNRSVSRGCTSDSATGANAGLSEASQSLEREAADLAGRLAAEEAASAESRRQAEAWLQTERDQLEAYVRS